MNGDGPLTTNSAIVNGFVSSPAKKKGERRPDLQILASSFDYNLDYGLGIKDVFSLNATSYNEVFYKFAEDYRGLIVDPGV